MQRIILKSIYGILSLDEQSQLNKWMKQSRNADLYQNIKEHLCGDIDMIEVMGGIDVEKALDDVKKSPFRKITWRRWAVAACLAALVATGSGIWYKNYTKVTPPEISKEVAMAMHKCKEADRSIAVSDLMGAAKHGVMRKVSTPKDKECWITLDDGTIVHLNNESKINYPTAFGRGDREVTLRGEAYFMVAKDKSRPFIVHTDNGDVKVYGTEFNVSAGQNTEVVLVKGSVGVESVNGVEYRLTPGEKADMSDVVRISKVDTTPYESWNKGVFFFKDWPLEKIMNVLGKWYDRKVVFANDGIKHLSFSGNFERYEDIHPLMDAISMVTGLTITVEEREITITSNKQ